MTGSLPLQRANSECAASWCSCWRADGCGGGGERLTRSNCVKSCVHVRGKFGVIIVTIDVRGVCWDDDFVEGGDKGVALCHHAFVDKRESGIRKND